MTLTSPAALSDADVAAVRDLAAAIEAADGAPPLSDQALASLRSSAVTHTLATDGAVITGYAQLAGSSLEIAGAVPELLAAFAGRNVLVWSHGRRSRLVPLLTANDFVQVRILHQLRQVPATVPPSTLAADVTIRPFVVGQDEDAWLAVNAAAFATHPEQGLWTSSDLAAREAEAWFDPSGFLLAWRGPELVGFHWTKVHPDGLGEVYVIGIAPSAQGGGLGRALLAAGLAHLLSRGCPGVLLYVDDDNAAAMALYERTGFSRYDVDVQWRAGAQR